MAIRENHSSAADRQRALRAICQSVLADLDGLVTDSVDRIRSELADYERVSLSEHHEAVRVQHRRRTTCILEERPPDVADLREASDLAQARAQQGISIATLISAYHIGDRELWRRIAASATLEHSWLLPDIAAHMMESLHTLTGTLASAHSEVTRSIQGHKITLTQRLVDLLIEGNVKTEATRIAEALALSVNGTFQALVWSPAAAPGGVSFGLYRALERAGHQMLYSSRGSDLVLLSPSGSSHVLRSFATQHLGEGRCGLGLARDGLAGAAQSIGDALLALTACHENQSVVSFNDTWIESAVLAQGARLEPLIGAARAIAGEHPMLARTVEAFARNNMSIAATSTELEIHPNTVTYRLERWSTLVSWDPRTFDGLSRSVLACRSARTQP